MAKSDGEGRKAGRVHLVNSTRTETNDIAREKNLGKLERVSNGGEIEGRKRRKIQLVRNKVLADIKWCGVRLLDTR